MPALGIAHLEIAFLADEGSSRVAATARQRSPQSDNVVPRTPLCFLVGDDVRLQAALERSILQEIDDVELDADRALHVGCAATDEFSYSSSETVGS